MRSLISLQSGSLHRSGRLGFLLAALLLAAAQPASAATWGHLRGPFSAESQQLERANYAAEERASHRDTAPCRIWHSAWRQVVIAHHHV